jgi:uncharacterized OsmC-like protein
MEAQARIKTAVERSVKALSERPYLGQGTAVTKVRLREGLACEAEEGPWRVLVDMSEKSGGSNTGPNPGVIGRAALGSCLTVAYGLWAARLGVPLTSLEVEVQADYDARGEYGLADVPVGYLRARYIVTVESPAPEADVLRMLDEADRHCAYLDVWTRPMDVRREVRISTTQEA